MRSSSVSDGAAFGGASGPRTRRSCSQVMPAEVPHRLQGSSRYWGMAKSRTIGLLRKGPARRLYASPERSPDAFLESLSSRAPARTRAAAGGRAQRAPHQPRAPSSPASNREGKFHREEILLAWFSARPFRHQLGDSPCTGDGQQILFSVELPLSVGRRRARRAAHACGVSPIVRQRAHVRLARAPKNSSSAPSSR
jgi:hypothetical protein